MKSILYLFGLLALPVQAASFDCAKALSKVEHMICDNPGLSGLDDRLAALYKAALQNKAGAGDINNTQKQWLNERNTCGDVSCLDALYLRRLSDLDMTVSQMERKPSGVASEVYALVMSKNDEMCNHMLKIMNDDMEQFNRTYDSNDRFVSSVEEFKTIPWKPARASFEKDGQVYYWDVERALFDLNNDGVIDFVVRDKSMLSGMRADSIDMLDATAAMHGNNLTVNELKSSKNHIQMAGGGYALSAQFVGRIESLWLLSPFIYHGVSYVYMQSLYRNDEAVGGDFVVIAKYIGGKFVMREMTGKMDDICYIERVDVK